MFLLTPFDYIALTGIVCAALILFSNIKNRF